MNGTEIYKFKAKDSEIVATSLCLGNISKDWSVDNAVTDVDDIKDIHKYLMKKNDIE